MNYPWYIESTDDFAVLRSTPVIPMAVTDTPGVTFPQKGIAHKRTLSAL